jgi:hypothetical protein
MEKSQKYIRQMADLGFRQARVWIPAALETAYLDRAAADRIDYLHAVVEDAPDGDARLGLMAEMNRVQPLTHAQKAELRANATNATKVAAALQELDTLEAIMWSAMRDAHTAEGGPAPHTAVRHYARATLAALDYRRQRDLLQRGQFHGA